MGDVQAQVVVVGGGPVGLLLACELAGYGVRTLVVEAETGVSGWPKATTLHARAVQCLVRRSYLGGLARAGKQTNSALSGCTFHFAGIPGLTISAPPTEPQPVLKCPQEELESLFEERARAAGAMILRGYRVTEARQGPDGVHVTAEGPRGRVTCAAEYVVGADGARSIVREQAGFDSRTYPATVSAMAGDVRLEEAGALRPGWHRTSRGWIAAKDVPHSGRIRLRTLNCAAPHRAWHLPLTLEELRGEVSWIAGRDIALRAPEWLSKFSDFCRIVHSYQKGRILLAGDAAHVHFPIGGQALSTGLLDALNLGWKLALTVRGAAGEGLLGTYGQERRPAAQQVIDNTQAQLALMRPEAELDPLRALFRELMAGGSESSVLASMISAQDTMLPARGADSSPWEGSFLQNVELTTRQGRTDVISLLGDGRPLLLLFGRQAGGYEAQAQSWAGLLRVVRAEPVPDLPCEAMLVRPDGYVGWAAGGDRLTSALRAYFGEGGGAVADGVEARGARPGAVS